MNTDVRANQSRSSFSQPSFMHTSLVLRDLPKGLFLVFALLILIPFAHADTLHFTQNPFSNLTYRIDSLNTISCKTYSMSPTFDCYSKLEAVAVYNKSALQVGDIVRYSITIQMRREHPDWFPDHSVGYIIHRIVNVTSKGFITRGDNNQINDPWIVEPRLVSMKVVKIW